MAAHRVRQDRVHGWAQRQAQYKPFLLTPKVSLYIVSLNQD
jgi:hypothetical protein